MKIASAIGKEMMPLVQNMVGSYVEGKAMEKHSKLFDTKSPNHFFLSLVQMVI